MCWVSWVSHLFLKMHPFCSNKPLARAEWRLQWYFSNTFPSVWMYWETICLNTCGPDVSSLAPLASPWCCLESRHQGAPRGHWDAEETTSGQAQPQHAVGSFPHICFRCHSFFTSLTMTCMKIWVTPQQDLCFFKCSFSYLLYYVDYKALLSQPVLQNTQVALKTLVQLQFQMQYYFHL